MAHACLRSTFDGYSVGALREWLRRDLPRPRPQRPVKARILIIPPSTVFAALWQAATAAWLAGARVVVRPSRRETVFPRLLTESVISIAPGLLPITLDEPARELQNLDSFDAVVIYGRDATVAKLQALARKKVIGFGTRISLGWIGRNPWRHGTLHDLAERAAWDVAIYETQGCLSPSCFFVEEDRETSALFFARELERALERLEARLPRSIAARNEFEEDSFRQKWRFRQSQGLADIPGRHVVLRHDPRLEPAGVPRLSFVAGLCSQSRLMKACGKWWGRVSTIGVSDKKTLSGLRKRFRGHRSLRLCLIGRMHQPEPWWRNGGVNLLGEIARRIGE